MIKRTVYFGNPAYLSLRENQMVIKLPQVERSDMTDALKKEAERTLPIEDLGIVLLDTRQIPMTAALVEALQESNCAVVTCNDKHMPVGLMLPMDCHTLQSVRYQRQISASQPLRKQLWQQTVRAKIVNQRAVLEWATKDKHKCMGAWAEDVRSGDSENMEARASAYYWLHIFPSIDGFVRGRDGEVPNDLLNYGYAIVRAIVARSLVGSGLLPTIGLFHHNKYNAYCLADDIMEPYRPYVDKKVVELVWAYGAGVGLTKEIKAAFLGLAVEDTLIDGHQSPLAIAATTTSASLFECFDGQRRQILYPAIEL